MKALQKRGLNPCTRDFFVAWLEGLATLREDTFVLTFDVGFRGFYELAFPLLSAMGWTATVFLVTGLLGKHDQWTASENPGGKTYPLLGLREIDEMARAGFSFQSHSRTHPDLTKLTRIALTEELMGARQDLEDLLGRPVPYVAYPYGRYNEDVLGATQAAGYTAAFSVQPGFNRRDVDRYRIRRLDIFGTDTAPALLRKVAFGSNDGSWWQAVRYFGQRVSARLT
jgi:peptidoglycan/xylan/chitin deacetylase (PgdA/CDA1 family)